MSMRRLSLSLGWSALLMLSAQTTRSEPMPYQCFDRTTRRPVAASLVDLSTAEVSCEPTTLPQPENTPSELGTTASPEQVETEPKISSGPSPYADVTADPNAVNATVRNTPLAARRSINLARGAATRMNGGLRVYRPGICMYASASNNPCLIHAGPAGFEFNIPGGSPGWEEAGDAPSVMTRVLIAADGRSVLQIDQNDVINSSTSD